MSTEVRLAVVDDHQLFAETMVLALRQAGYVSHRFLVGDRPTTTDDVLRDLLDYQPSIALVDIELGPVGNGLSLVRPLVAAGTAVLVITSAPTPQWGEGLAAGASRVIAKTSPLHEILACIEAMSQGRPVLSPAVRDELVREWEATQRASESIRSRLASLSTSEQEVLAALMDGSPVRDIARHRVVSEATVRTQISAVLGKLEVSSQLAAVVLAGQVGWRPSAPRRHAP